ncbi:MAG: phosphatase PAP2 family protein [Deltaproteobacteria bacterium]|nr:phosphatase PAP2 family protein [Deltaproteobacteria bacterium]
MIISTRTRIIYSSSAQGESRSRGYRAIRFLFLLLSAVLVVNENGLFAQDNALKYKNVLTHCERVKNEDFRLGEEYIATYVQDTWDIVTFPVRWEWTDWVLASAVVGGTIGFFALDDEIRDWMQHSRTGTSNTFAKIGRPFGEGQYTLPPMALLYLYGHLFEDKRARKLALLTVEGFAITGLFTQLIKFSGHRHRPSTGDSSDTWDGPSFSQKNLAFPSGHVSSAASVATIIASEYEKTIVIPILAYGMAGLTAFSRVNDNGHWASDVFFAYALGFFTSRFVFNAHSYEKRTSARLYPSIEGGSAYLNFAWRF